ncbi:MAG: pilus assembly protein N-terminal domain-containing protein [Burkholderiaceae bacterium]
MNKPQTKDIRISARTGSASGLVRGLSPALPYCWMLALGFPTLSAIGQTATIRTDAGQQTFEHETISEATARRLTIPYADSSHRDGSAVASSIESTKAITLVIGHAQVLEPGPIKRLAVGDGKVLQATAIDKKQVLVLPEKVGQSTLHLWPETGPMQTYLITVVASDAARSLAEIRAMLGVGGNVHAQLVGESVLIEGHALSAAQLARIAVIAKRYPHVVNLTGGAGAERMIAMDVRMIEIKKSAIQKIGVRWSPTARGPTFGILGDIYRSNALRGTEVAAELGLSVRNRLNPFASALSVATSVTSVLDFLVQNGDAVILAEPRLSCRSGGSARFVAGGELPIPQSSGLGAMSVTFKEYGVRFDFSPTAGLDGIISAKIATEVSAVDFDVMVQDVPGLIKRRAETEVNLRENQTLVIAGLLAEDAAGGVDKIAGLGDIPVLGKLFRSRDYRSQKTDLVVFVTPRFIEDPQAEISQLPYSGHDAASGLANRLRIVE